MGKANHRKSIAEIKNYMKSLKGKYHRERDFTIMSTITMVFLFLGFWAEMIIPFLVGRDLIFI